jgi:hypothetical protein
LPPENGAFTVQTLLLASTRQILAWKTPRYYIDRFQVVKAAVADVVVARYVRPVLFQHLLTVAFYFDLPSYLVSFALKAQIETAYTGEKRSDRRFHPAASSTW